jgi:hypothetical protein
MDRLRRGGQTILTSQVPWNLPHQARLTGANASMEEETMDGLIYLIGLIVVIMAILSFFGLR